MRTGRGARRMVGIAATAAFIGAAAAGPRMEPAAGGPPPGAAGRGSPGAAAGAQGRPAALRETGDGEAAYAELAVDLLLRYLRIDTSNPPGNEAAAARFLREILEREGIPAEVDEFAPGRANLAARLKATVTGRSRRGALAMMHHMDVVPADPSRWRVPPFRGVVEDGVVYGRGAQDTKTEGVLHLAALIRARRERLPLARDLVFIATADEESGFAGGLRLAEKRRDMLEGVEYIVTEGGDNIREADDRARFFALELAEKGPLWLTLRTTGTPGHGSKPIADSAVNRLLRALERVRLHATELKVLPAAERFLRDMAPTEDPPRSGWFRDIRKALQDPEARRALSDDREVAYLLRNTVSITVLRAGYKTNVIPGTAEAQIDVRLLPGEDPQKFLEEIRRVIDDPTVEIEPDQAFRAPNASPWETEFVQAATAVLGGAFPDVPITAKLASGATECVLYRPLGIHCYGFTPLLATREESASAHGDDERVRADTVRRSTGLFYEFVRRLCGADQTSPKG